MKKSLAVMLALIMVLCMIPTTALAATMSWEWTVTIIGGNYYKADGIQTSTNKYTINQHLDNSVDHEIGYKFEWNASAGGSNYNGGWQLCLTVDGSIVERSTAYIYDRDMSNASGTWTAPKSSHTGNSTHPFTLYLSNYPARFQKITLKYDANGGTNAPASETKQVEKGQSATFTVSNQKPTRENYTFKGWSTDENAATAEYIVGNNITISQDTTLYAVWANHEHKDENDDGYCDTDRECMHEKDEKGYCTVEGCTHPHEGDGACCPKKPDNKPNPPKPENTPAIPGLTELNEVVKVKCNTAPESHKEKTFGFNWFSCEVGEVINDNDEYFCTITVLPDGYVESYNQEFPDHTLDPDGQKETLKLKWNATDKQWENTESAKLPITFTVKCDTVEPTEPPKPNATDIPRIVGSGAVKVHCNANTEHKDEIYGLLEDSFDIGDVTKDEVSGEYTCTITVQPDKYVAAYNGVYAGHILAPAGQTRTITLKWEPDVGQDGTRTWVVVSDIPVEFTVKCEDVNTYTVTYKDGVGGTAFKDQVHTGLKLGDATPGFTGTPYRWNYTFTGWKPAVAPTVSGNAVYTAQWSYNGGGWTPSYPINPVPPVVVVPPKTGDMPFWYSIAQFLGLVK